MNAACPAAGYATAEEAKAVRRALRTRHHLAINIYQCEQCDHYHPRVQFGTLYGEQRNHRGDGLKKALKVLRMFALGYSGPEIARMEHMPFNTIKWYIKELKFAFGANSVQHLVAVAISLGYLDPRDFVPTLVERTHPDDGLGQQSENLHSQAM